MRRPWLDEGLWIWLKRYIPDKNWRGTVDFYLLFFYMAPIAATSVAVAYTHTYESRHAFKFAQVMILTEHLQPLNWQKQQKLRNSELIILIICILFCLCVSDCVCICAWMLYAMCFGPPKCFCFCKCHSIFVYVCGFDIKSENTALGFGDSLCLLPLWWRFPCNTLIQPLRSLIFFNYNFFCTNLEVVLWCRL